VFNSIKPFHLNRVIVGKAGVYPSETLGDSACLPFKYSTWAEVNVSGKRTSLLYHAINYHNFRRQATGHYIIQKKLFIKLDRFRQQVKMLIAKKRYSLAKKGVNSVFKNSRQTHCGVYE